MAKKKRWVKLRILPITMAVATVMLFMKLGDVNRDIRLVMSSAHAESEEKPETTANIEKKEETASAEKPSESTTDTTVPEEKPEGAGAVSTDKKDDAASDEDKKPENPEEPKKEFSQLELDVLQNLSKRREEIEQWAKDVEMKENLLGATEQRIDDKIKEIKALKKQVDDLLATYNEQEDSKIRSLVKIYENMKPKEAASIFEELEMPILLLVVDRMSERKVAPILAGMTPKKAMQVTKELAEQRKISAPPAPIEDLPEEASQQTPPHTGEVPAEAEGNSN